MGIEVIGGIIVAIGVLIGIIIKLTLFKSEKKISDVGGKEATMRLNILKRYDREFKTVSETIPQIIDDVNKITSATLGFQPLDSSFVDFQPNHEQGVRHTVDSNNRLIILVDSEESLLDKSIGEALFFVIQHQFLEKLKQHMEPDISHAFNLAMTKYFLHELAPSYSRHFEQHMRTSKSVKNDHDNLNPSDQRMWNYYKLFVELLERRQFNQIVLRILVEFAERAPIADDETKNELTRIMDLLKNLGDLYKGNREYITPIKGDVLSLTVAKIGGPWGNRYERFIMAPETSPPCKHYLNDIVKDKEIDLIFLVATDQNAVKLTQSILRYYNDHGMNSEEIELPSQSENEKDSIVGILFRKGNLEAMRE